MRVRCLKISGSRKPRYEIYMDASGVSAVVDISSDEGLPLEARIHDIVSAFVDSLELRGA